VKSYARTSPCLVFRREDLAISFRLRSVCMVPALDTADGVDVAGGHGLPHCVYTHRVTATRENVSNTSNNGRFRYAGRMVIRSAPRGQIVFYGQRMKSEPPIDPQGANGNPALISLPVQQANRPARPKWHEHRAISLDLCCSLNRRTLLLQRARRRIKHRLWNRLGSKPTQLAQM